MIVLLACAADVAPGNAWDPRDSPGEDSSTDTGPPTIDPPDAHALWEADHGLTMVDVPPGSFVMGSPPEEVGRYIPEAYGGDGTDRETQHDVVFTRALRVSAFEMTQAEHSALMEYNPSFYRECGDTCPVEWVTWHEAAAYTVALSGLAGLDACYTCEGDAADVVCAPASAPYLCTGYRLPTEAEWEYFARAGQTAAYLGGGGIVEGQEELCDPDLTLDNGALLGDEAWWCGNAKSPQPVGGRPPNAWGLYDIEGNIHEWTDDWYGATWYLDPAASLPDPAGPGSGTEKVRRGGGWAYDPWRLRLAYRGWHDPTEPADRVGFRIVRSVW